MNEDEIKLTDKHFEEIGNELKEYQPYIWSTITPPRHNSYYNMYSDGNLTINTISGGIDPVETPGKSSQKFNIDYDDFLGLRDDQEPPIKSVDDGANWKSLINKPKKSKKPSPKYQLTRMDLDSYFELDRCLDCFDELLEKQIGDIYLTGSVALFIQGKISRSQFKDLDIVILGEYSLDDDMIDLRVLHSYPENRNGNTRKAICYNNTAIDIFSVKDSINVVDVEYEGKVYKCQDYKDIIMEKLWMVLPNMKDYKELMDGIIEINIK